jgi:hypothetical protein
MKQVTIFLLAAVCFLMLTMTIQDANGNHIAGTNNHHVGNHSHAHRSNRAARSIHGKPASNTNHNGTHHHSNGAKAHP